MSFATLCKSFLILKKNLLSRWQPELPAGTQPALLLHYSLWYQNGSLHNFSREGTEVVRYAGNMNSYWCSKRFQQINLFSYDKDTRKGNNFLIYVSFSPQYFFFSCNVLGDEISGGEVGFLEWEWSQNVLLITKFRRGKIIFRTEKKGQTTWRCPILWGWWVTWWVTTPLR